MVRADNMRGFALSMLAMLILLGIFTNTRGEVQSVANIFLLLSVFATLWFLFQLIRPFVGTIGVQLGRGVGLGGDLLLPVGVGIAYILSAVVLPQVVPLSVILFTLAVPQLQFSVGTQVFGLLTPLLFAPVLEELVFGGAVPSFLQSTFGLSITITTFVTALLFSAFHFLAFTQGAYISAVSPFIGAFVFRILNNTLIIRQKNLLSGMLLHAIINGFIIFNARLI